MSFKIKMKKKTLAILCGIVLLFLLAIFFGLHILGPALDPITRDMVKIFLCGGGCGLLIGIWLGSKIERYIKKEESKHDL